MDSLNPPGGRGLLFYAGAGALLAAMLVETVAVIGRHAHLPLTGALEIVQVAIVPAACASMLVATLRGAHAAVHLFTDRMPETLRRRVVLAGATLAGICFTALSVGCAWLTVEYWNSFEQTEVLHIPFRPVRVLVTLSAALLAAAFFRRAFGSEKTA